MLNNESHLSKSRYTCTTCTWTGLGKEGQRRELFDDLIEIDCPHCGEKLEMVSLNESFDLDNEAELFLQTSRKLNTQAIRTTSTQDDFSHLHDPTQLPNIDLDFIILTMDIEPSTPGRFIIRHGLDVIWQEVSPNGLAGRFTEICTIIRLKYSDHLHDLVLTPRAQQLLAQDNDTAPDMIRKFRLSLPSKEQTPSTD